MNARGIELNEDMAGSRPVVPGLAVILHGAWAGWAALLFVVRSGVIAFNYSDPADGLINLCTTLRYPKHQDYCWYGAMLAAGLAGAGLNALALKRLVRDGRVGRLGTAFLLLALGFAAAGTGLLFTAGWWRSPLTLLSLAAAGLLPWFCARWYSPAGSLPVPAKPRTVLNAVGWLAACLALSFVWVYDGGYYLRWIDGYHEGGNHLLVVQGYLAGDTPGIGVRTVYGPLYHFSLIWWMKIFGMTVSSERVYFMLAQMAGTAIHLYLVRLVCGNRAVALAGMWLMLTLSTAPALGYGWANALRTAIPLGAFVSCRYGIVRGSGRLLAVSGLLTACGMLYSQEFGAAGALGCLLLLSADAFGVSRRLSGLYRWSASVLAAFLVLMAAMYRGRVATAIGKMFLENYAMTQLKGHYTLPLAGFPWFTSLLDAGSKSGDIIYQLSVWGPGLLCVLAAGWLASRRERLVPGNGPLLGALVLMALLSQLPVLARPMGQVGTSMPVVVLMAAVFFDMTVGADRPGGGARKGLILAASFLWGLSVSWPEIKSSYLEKYNPNPFYQVGARGIFMRLGLVKLKLPRDETGIRAMQYISRALLPGERIYVAAPFYSHLCFLTGHPGMAPFVSASMVRTLFDREAMVRILEEQKPPMTLLTEGAIDVPFAVSHPEEWAYIKAHYVMKLKINDLSIWMLKSTASRVVGMGSPANGPRY